MAKETDNNVPQPVHKLYLLLLEFKNLVNPALSAGISLFITLWISYPAEERWRSPAVKYVVLSALLIIAWIVSYLTWLRPRYSELVRKNNDQQSELQSTRTALQAALDSLLRNMLEDSKLANSTCRVSAYAVTDDRFVLLSRYSMNTKHEKRGRSTYPLNQGVIGLAWERGSDLTHFNVETRSEWEVELVNSGRFNADEAKKLTMFARAILAVRIDAGDGTKVGVLVFESENASQFQPNMISQVRRRSLFNPIQELISGWSEQFPRVKEWDEERRRGTKIRLLDEPEWKNPAPTD